MWLSDHLSDEGGWWFADAWTSLGAILSRIPRIEAGTLVASNSLRAPLLTAHMSRTLATIAPGRFVLGLGAGGDRTEHLRVGVEFAPLDRRLAELAEACVLVRRVIAAGSPWASDVGSDDGNEVGVGGQVELLLGGTSDGLLRLAGAIADRWAVWGTPAQLATHGARLSQYALVAHRDPAEVRRGVIVMLRPAGLPARADQGSWPAALLGDDEAVLGQLAEYAAAGVTEVIGCDFAVRPDARAAALEWFAGIAGRLRGQ